MNVAEDLTLHYDVVIVGAGPAGLAAAIHIKQFSPALTVCVLEKAASIGAHQLSGAIVPENFLSPLQAMGDFSSGPPSGTPVTQTQWQWFTRQQLFSVPDWLLPPVFRKRNQQQLIQLSSLCRWLGDEALSHGVEIFTAQAAVSAIYDEEGNVAGVMTGALGCLDDGTPGPQFVPGIAIKASYTLLAEGAKGSLSREISAHFDCAASVPQHYGLGFKERWYLPQGGLKAGQVIHCMGWPLGHHAGGGFLYALSEHELAVGLILQLDYQNPALDPFELFRQFKSHPSVAVLLEGAECQGFGARTLSEGGWQSLGELIFPGGAFIGCAAGLLDLLHQQGIPHAIQSGVLAAKACVNAITNRDASKLLFEYERAVKAGEIADALQQARAIKPALSLLGGLLGTAYIAAHYWLKTMGLGLPRLAAKQPDHAYLKDVLQKNPSDALREAERENALYLARIKHNELQPTHLQLANGQSAVTYLDEEAWHVLSHCCPATVYTEDETFSIRTNRCLHCKCCEIKDPGQQIRWIPPEGGSGPVYSGL